MSAIGGGAVLSADLSATSPLHMCEAPCAILRQQQNKRCYAKRDGGRRPSRSPKMARIAANIAKLPELRRGDGGWPKKTGASSNDKDDCKAYAGHYGEAGEDGDQFLRDRDRHVSGCRLRQPSRAIAPNVLDL